MNQDTGPAPTGAQSPPAQPAYRASTQPPKSNKTLIIVLIVVFLLLCCCCATTGAFLGIPYLANQSSDSVSTSSTTGGDSLSETARVEWDAWNPELGDVQLDPASDWQTYAAEEIVAKRYPDFVLADIGVIAGGWSEADNAYAMDYYVIRVDEIGNPEVAIGEYVYVWTEEAVEAGADGTITETDDGQELDTLADGTEYIFPLSNSLMHGETPEEIRVLLDTVAREWPGALITSVRYGESGESEVKVSITSWDYYRTHHDFEGVGAIYVLQDDGTWELDSYHWRLAEDE